MIGAAAHASFRSIVGESFQSVVDCLHVRCIRGKLELGCGRAFQKASARRG